MTAARKWTKEEIQFIKDNSHMNDREMAEAMGIPRPTLNAFRNKIGCTSSATGILETTEENVKYLIDLYEQGYKCPEIKKIVKEKLGKTISESRLERILRNKGFIRKRKYGKKEEMPESKLEELTMFNQKINAIKVNIAPGDCFKTRDIDRDGKYVQGEILRAKGVYPNFVHTVCGKCIAYDEIEGVIRRK